MSQSSNPACSTGISFAKNKGVAPIVSIYVRSVPEIFKPIKNEDPMFN
jgi:hypothetical protein